MTDIPPDDLKRFEDKLDDVRERLARLEALRETESERCPFRPAISQIKENVARVEKSTEKNALRVERVEKRVHALELTWAKALGLMIGSGVTGGVVGQLLQGLW